ncbi:hypothetical protein PFMG_04540 [Plasmodium falciparum IGH-CR14]|uniref:Plasmodium RESA N-terminal domain-containing protein n=1 Tax=Plasmodium falciparum IGH-CR14 TaxID=580059 RepID=A0A0L1IGF5_PLAFA|nr:hypothetical protein PFMG_04540 [Plasmodium falciparum IGH-CR14]
MYSALRSFLFRKSVVSVIGVLVALLNNECSEDGLFSSHYLNSRFSRILSSANNGNEYDILDLGIPSVFSVFSLNEFGLVVYNKIDNELDADFNDLDELSETFKDDAYNHWVRVMKNEESKYFQNFVDLSTYYDTLKKENLILDNYKEDKLNECRHIVPLKAQKLIPGLTKIFEDWTKNEILYKREFETLINSVRIAWKALTNYALYECKNIFIKNLDEIEDVDEEEEEEKEKEEEKESRKSKKSKKKETETDEKKKDEKEKDVNEKDEKEKDEKEKDEKEKDEKEKDEKEKDMSKKLMKIVQDVLQESVEGKISEEEDKQKYAENLDDDDEDDEEDDDDEDDEDNDDEDDEDNDDDEDDDEDNDDEDDEDNDDEDDEDNDDEDDEDNDDDDEEDKGVYNLKKDETATINKDIKELEEVISVEDITNISLKITSNENNKVAILKNELSDFYRKQCEKHKVKVEGSRGVLKSCYNLIKSELEKLQGSLNKYYLSLLKANVLTKKDAEKYIDNCLDSYDDFRKKMKETCEQKIIKYFNNED